jgi:hypothetical protein
MSKTESHLNYPIMVNDADCYGRCECGSVHVGMPVVCEAVGVYMCAFVRAFVYVGYVYTCCVLALNPKTL